MSFNLDNTQRLQTMRGLDRNTHFFGRRACPNNRLTVQRMKPIDGWTGAVPLRPDRCPDVRA